MTTTTTTNPIDAAFRILQPQATKPEKIPNEQLIEHVLAAINNDRKKSGLNSVELSTNQAAQLHAEDVFKTKQISHWMTTGEKPYMTYTRLEGKGSVHQNVAIAGFGPDEYNRCASTVILCERINPISTLDELEHEMMYNDANCCNNGHRDNILDNEHTHVSIGIAYDPYYLVLVQNFEADYGLTVNVKEKDSQPITTTTPTFSTKTAETAITTGAKVSITGPIPQGAKFENVAIYYDPLPTAQEYNANKLKNSYDPGKLVAVVFEPLPLGLRYQQSGDYLAIEANSWHAKGDLDVNFDLTSPVINNDGVYTVYAMFEDAYGRQFSATSHSITVTRG